MWMWVWGDFIFKSLVDGSMMTIQSFRGERQSVSGHQVESTNPII